MDDFPLDLSSSWGDISTGPNKKLKVHALPNKSCGKICFLVSHTKKLKFQTVKLAGEKLEELKKWGPFIIWWEVITHIRHEYASR